MGGLALIGGCGFELRKPLAMAFQSIALADFDARSQLADELRRSLSDSVRLVNAPSEAQVVLHALVDRSERSVASSTGTGQVRELQVRVRFTFRLTTPSDRELLAPTELLLARDMSYNETNALAKEQEEAQMIRAMQSDIVAQVMRRLAAVQL